MTAAVQDWDKDALDNDYTKTCAAGCALSLSFGLIATVAGAAAVFLQRKYAIGEAPAERAPTKSNREQSDRVAHAHPKTSFHLQDRIPLASSTRVPAGRDQQPLPRYGGSMFESPRRVNIVARAYVTRPGTTRVGAALMCTDQELGR